MLTQEVCVSVIDRIGCVTAVVMGEPALLSLYFVNCPLNCGVSMYCLF